MEINIKRRFFPIVRNKPDPAFLAAQLRKPSGDFAEKIAAKMNEVNSPLFYLTLNTLNLADEESVLEIGFGSGEFFDDVFEQAENLKISGLDYSGEMVKHATTSNQSRINSGELQIKQGNSNDIPFPDNSFDQVFCNMVIYFWERPEEHLEEIKRVLKPNGKFYTGFRSKESMLALPFIEHGFVVYSEQEWCEVLQDNGFEVVQMEKKRDPEKDIEEEAIQMESICIAAEPLKN